MKRFEEIQGRLRAYEDRRKRGEYNSVPDIYALDVDHLCRMVDALAGALSNDAHVSDIKSDVVLWADHIATTFGEGGEA